MMICKRCGAPINFLSHICDDLNDPMLLQVHKGDVKIIVNALKEYQMKYYDKIRGDMNEYARFQRLIEWLEDQLDKC